MSDLAVTAANVKAGANAVIDRQHNAGATVTAGQQVYFDSTTSKWKLADTNSATAAARAAAGTALNGASDGQPLAVQTGGDITIGATLTPGVAYYLSGTPGGIAPVGDLTTGDYPCVIGMAKSSTVLALNYQSAGAAL